MHGGYSMASHWSRCISHKIVCHCSKHEECGLRYCCWGSSVTVWLHFLTCHDDACSLLIKRNPHTHINTHTHEYLTRAIRVWAFPASTLTPAPKQTSPWQLQAQKRKREKKDGWRGDRKTATARKEFISFNSDQISISPAHSWVHLWGRDSAAQDTGEMKPAVLVSPTLHINQHLIKGK